MKYNEFTMTQQKHPKRVGRGIAAGQGKTAGRGTKGQKARTGYSKRPGFEGGQNPLMQRLPKLHGFHSHRVKASVVYTGQLDQMSGKTIDTTLLTEHGLIENQYQQVKLISKGEVTKKHTIKLQLASQLAVTQVEKAGGTFSKVPRQARPATKDKATKDEEPKLKK